MSFPGWCGLSMAITLFGPGGIQPTWLDRSGDSD